jgi:hypothetical protein
MRSSLGLASEVLFFRWMKRIFYMLLAALGLLASLQAIAGAAKEPEFIAPLVRTNYVDRWITNTTAIQMQVDRFVTEYRTNWLAVVHTNVVNLYTTNILTTFVTNRFVMVHTNLVNLFSTNLTTRTLTNRFVLEQTNFVQAYQTNLKVLHLTNWTTVLAFKTNWVTKPMTNLVEIDMTPNANAVPAPTPAPSAVNSVSTSEALSIKASRNAKLTANNLVEVQIKASWTKTPEAPVQVQQWRIEREDGQVLCFGQDPEFRRALPAGTYRVVLKAQRDAQGPLMAAMGTLTVTQREVLLEQRPARNSSI